MVDLNPICGGGFWCSRGVGGEEKFANIALLPNLPEMLLEAITIQGGYELEWVLEERKKKTQIQNQNKQLTNNLKYKTLFKIDPKKKKKL